MRAKESKADILKVKSFIEKKAWPYVQNDLRLKAGYLRFDLRTVIAAKTKDEKKMLKELESTVYTKLDEVLCLLISESIDLHSRLFQNRFLIIACLISVGLCCKDEEQYRRCCIICCIQERS